MNRVEGILVKLKSINKGGNLVELAVAFKNEGMGQDEMYKLFDLCRAQEENKKCEVKYNAILDTMDYIVGHCSQDQKLFENGK